MHMDIHEAGNNATPAHIGLGYPLQRRKLRSNALYPAVSDEHIVLRKTGRTVHHGISQDAIHENSSERFCCYGAENAGGKDASRTFH